MTSFVRGFPSTLFLVCLLTTKTIARAGEYCIGDEFKEDCPAKEVIFVEGARYGRMKQGHCVDEALNLGCKDDVIEYLDSACSGRNSCAFKVRSLIDYKTPCPRDYTPYLEVEYRCVKVATGPTNYCIAPGNYDADGQSGYISSKETAATNYGTSSCPWTIKVTSGQRIQLDLYIFNLSSNHNCEPDIIIIDGEEKTERSVCENHNRNRPVPLYTSVTKQIIVYVNNNKGYQQNQPIYLLAYRATGCPDIKIPQNAWSEYISGNSLRVKCNYTDETWFLTCKDNRWLGELGNCSGLNSSPLFFGGSGSNFPIGVVVAVIIGVILGVVIGTTLLAVVFCLRKRHYNKNIQRNSEYYPKLPKEMDYDSTRLHMMEIDPRDPNYPTVMRHQRNFDQYRREATTHAHGNSLPGNRQTEEGIYGKVDYCGHPDARLYFELLPDQRAPNSVHIAASEDGKRSV